MADKIFTGRYRRGGKPVFLSPEAYQRDRVGMAFTNARIASQKKGLPFDLSVDYLIDIWPRDGLCPISKVEMIWGKESGRNVSPSLDRVIPEKGYVIGNVNWISNKMNSLKSDATVEQLKDIISYIERHKAE